MKIALIGYGKMGQAIEKLALAKGHIIVAKIDKGDDLQHQLKAKQIDVAIEFTDADAAYRNVYQCLAQGVPVVSGTTGWNDQHKSIETFCQGKKGTFFYASNFSIGMQIFFKINAYAASLMQHYPQYEVNIKETHHIEKKDAPSGTAITLAEQIISHISRKNKWQLSMGKDMEDHLLSIEAKREAQVPGTHEVTYVSPLDQISLVHTANDRKSFALGALQVAEWLPGHAGVLGMDDFLNINK